MDDHTLNLIKVAGFTGLMISLPLFVVWIAVRIYERPWRVTWRMKLLWLIERKLNMVRQKRSGWWLIILMAWDNFWRRK